MLALLFTVLAHKIINGLLADLFFSSQDNKVQARGNRERLERHKVKKKIIRLSLL